jgi:V8-like Glu-specific endopeptidase/N-acetyl-anhydromuramyl-L-alanine amidase AmpD
MPRIQANRDTIDDRFSVLGFTVRTESPLFEVAVATDPRLFSTQNRDRRAHANFHSSRINGAIRARRGEAVYLVPPDVLANFIGQPRLYFGLATYREGSGGVPDFVQAPTEGHMYVNLAGLTERGLRRLALRPTGSAYGASNGHDPSLDWGGDAQPQAAVSPAPANAITPAARNGNGNGATAPQAGASYDDGFGDFPPAPSATMPATAAAPAASAATPTAQALQRHSHALEDEGDDGEGEGIEGPIPDDDASGIGQDFQSGSQALEAPQPEYPGASRFAPAHPSNYRKVRSQREIRQVVIHITDGGSRITGTIGWFQNPNQRNARNQPIHVSAHYVVGRDGEVVQMVRNNDIAWHANAANGHSIGIEHVANSTRRLLPTDDEYRGSARLVAWLCCQFGLPIDRTHVLGHSEADTHTTHTNCPNSVWDWDRYMAMVQEEADALAAQSSAPATAQALSRRRVLAQAQEIITPFYDQSDPMSALACQDNAFSLAREEWFMGVADTTQFPHSAICQLLMTAADGKRYKGTGFYIGANRILTCAHNLDGMSSVTIMPGRNAAAMPFGQCTVTSASWRIARPPYTTDGNWENDLAVIDGVPLAAPNGQWFRFLNATPSERMPIVVCGYAKRSITVPQLTEAIDGDKQHLHGGYASSQSNLEVLEYPLLTLKGNSGSPVYHLDNSSGTLQALVCAVHVTGEPAAEGLNRGCFITPNKIDWIEGRATAFAVPQRRATASALQRTQRPQAIPGRAAVAQRPAARAKALIIGPEDVEQAQRYAPQWADLFNWSVPDWIPGYLAGRNMQVQRIADAVGALNLDRYEVRVTSMPEQYNAELLLEGVRLILNSLLDTDNSEFIPYTVGDDDIKWMSASPAGTVFKIDIVGPDNAAVVCSLCEPRRWRFTTVHTEWSGDHPVSGHREFGVREDADGTTVLYTRGADRATDGLGESIAFFGADHLWRSFQRKVVEFIASQGGTASAPEPFSQRFHPRVVEILYGQGGAVAQALENECYSIHWDTVPYYPQQTDSSCWAASAAMVVAWRDGTTLSDADIAAKVPALDAYRHGLWPSDRHMLADIWNLVPEPPACYTVDAWRTMLENYGPLYLDMTNSAGSGGHAWVLVGMTSDGAPDGSDTVMYLHNPTASRGRVKWNFQDFQGLYEGRVATEGSTLEHQILHAAALPAGARPVTAAPFSLGLASDVLPVIRRPTPRRAAQRGRVQSLGTESIEYPVQLVPQPNKLACWAASMTMLLSFRRNASFSPETLANEVGGSLMTSYGWDLLEAVRTRYGFVAVDVPSNTSFYFSPAQWAQWLRDFGPLWIVIVGMPHAVVVSGLRGNTDDANACEVKLLNPWDTRVSFDDDATEFHPANQGYADWLPFHQFASDFGNMAEPDYGNWRVLHLPTQQAGGATAQALAQTAVRRASNSARAALPTPPKSVRASALEDTALLDEPIEPSRVVGTTMRRVRGSRARVAWALDQLDGVKLADPTAAMVPALVPTTIALDQWPCVARDAVPLPLTVRFDAGGGAVGNVRITAGSAADLPYDVTVTATIEDEPQPIASAMPPQAALKVTIDVDFSGTPNGNVTARTKLRLVGNGRYDLESSWQ